MPANTPQGRGSVPRPTEHRSPPAFAADLFSAVVDGMGRDLDTWLHVSIDLPGRLEAPLLRAALAACATATPALACQFRQRFWRSRWEPVPEPRWLVEEYDAVSPERASALEAELFAQPADPGAELPVRLRLFHMAAGDRLFLRVSHLLADGGGTKNLCYALAEACRALAHDPTWRPPPRPRRHPLPRALACLRRASLGWLLWDILGDLRANLARRPLSSPLRRNGQGPNRCARLHLPATRVAALQAHSRPLRMTLNDLALAAFTRAMARAFPQANPPGSDMLLVVTADWRLREAHPGADIGNFSGLRPLLMGRLPCPPPWPHLRRVARITRRWRQAGPTLGPGILALAGVGWWPHAWIRAGLHLILSRHRPFARGATALTNIGPIQAERLDFGGGPCLAASVLAPTAHAPLLAAAISGCRGALDFSVAYPEGALEPTDAQALLAALDAELAELEEPESQPTFSS